MCVWSGRGGRQASRFCGSGCRSSTTISTSSLGGADRTPVLATAYDLRVFFTVVTMAPEEVTSRDVCFASTPPRLARTLRSTKAVVIWSRAKGVLDVYDGPVRCRNLCAGRGYLSPSSTQILGRFDVRSKGGGRRLAA
jgi:hypothetical protein